MKILISLVIVSSLSVVRPEVFTAISEVEPLLETHKRIIDDLEKYVQNDKKRLSLLQKEIQRYKTEHKMAMQDVPNYLGNPLNAFTLIKRLTTDLYEIEKSIRKGSGTEFLRNTTKKNSKVKYPTDEDLFGAAIALSRLQDTYKLETKELAEGVLNHVAYSTPLSASDCFQLGLALYNHSHFENCITWMAEALRKYKKDPEKHYYFSEVDIYDYIAYAHYLLGHYEEAIAWTNKLLELEPEHERCKQNLVTFKEEQAKALAKKQAQVQNGTYVDSEEKKDKKVDKNPLAPPFDYETLCRGEIEVAHSMVKNLYCYYVKDNHPFLKLAPIKAEQKFKDPDAYIFYDVISDNEIKAVKKLAKPKLKRAFTYNKRGKTIPAEYRICKIGWIKDWESDVVTRISQRVSDFTGLAINSMTAEDLQIANYGIGGHYEPHFDMGLQGNYKLNITKGNRLATVLFYMSEVAQGGATVFTELGLSVSPIKNAALFWWNLYPSCEADLSTIHAACPVLRGSKWVANKWIHFKGQDFARPCTLEYQPQGTGKPKPRPIHSATSYRKPTVYL